MLNYHATFTKGTVEFRLFQFDEPGDGRRGGLHAGQLKSYIQLCLALSQMAKEVKTSLQAALPFRKDASPASLFVRMSLAVLNSSTLLTAQT